jgi:hypothetical protein
MELGTSTLPVSNHSASAVIWLLERSLSLVWQSYLTGRPFEEFDPVYGELLFRQPTWHEILLHPFPYVIDFKRALNLARHRAEIGRLCPPLGHKGYLTVSDDRGRILAETQSDSAPFAALVANVPAAHETTVYLLLGDWFAWVALAALVFILVPTLPVQESTYRQEHRTFAIFQWMSNRRSEDHEGSWSC